MFYGDLMRRSVPRWVLFSSVCAPIVLVGGWAISAVLQGPEYDPASRTISILGTKGADGYWVMTSALIALGACHVITACGLRSAAFPGRVALGGGGAAAMMLVLFPAPSSGGSLDHGAVVTVGFSLLAMWPVLAVRRRASGRGGVSEQRPEAVPLDRSAPWGLRPGPSLMASGLMWLGGGWFLMALFVHDTAGAAERVLTFAQSFWPLVVVVSCVRQTARDEEPERA